MRRNGHRAVDYFRTAVKTASLRESLVGDVRRPTDHRHPTTGGPDPGLRPGESQARNKRANIFLLTLKKGIILFSQFYLFIYLFYISLTFCLFIEIKKCMHSVK